MRKDITLEAPVLDAPVEGPLSTEVESSVARAHRISEEAIAQFITSGVIDHDKQRVLCDLISGWKKSRVLSSTLRHMQGMDPDVDNVQNNFMFGLIEGGVQRLHDEGEDMVGVLQERRDEVQERIGQLVSLAHEVTNLPLVTPVAQRLEQIFPAE